MSCSRCGAQVAGRFCHVCGAPIEAAAGATPEQPADATQILRVPQPPAGVPEPADGGTQPLDASQAADGGAHPLGSPMPPDETQVLRVPAGEPPPSAGPPSGSPGSGSGSPLGPAWERLTGSLRPDGTSAPLANRLWTVIGLLAAAGVLLIGVSLYALWQIHPLLSGGGLLFYLGLFIVLVLLVPLGLGGLLLYLARRLQFGDRVARVVTIVLCIALAAACLLSAARDLGWVLTALLAIAVVVLLTADPLVRAHFTGEDARYGAEPSTVVAARTLMLLVAACEALVGISFLVLGVFLHSGIFWGIVFLAIAGAIVFLSRQLARGDATARVLTTGLALVFLILSLIAGYGYPGVILPVALSIAVVGLLWVPAESRRYFAGMARPTHPVILNIERSIDGFSASLTGHPGTGSGGSTPDP